MRIPKNNYSRTLASGYVLMAVQIGLALATIPLALHHLGVEQFGVWALALQVATWLQLLDAGMNGAVARHLIDYQKDTSSRQCRFCVSTGFRILCLQGFIVLAMAVFLGFLGNAAFGLSPVDASSFRQILWILGIASCIGFSTKILQAWLYAAQRLDIVNCIAIGLMLAEWILLVILLKAGHGLYSLAWARLVSTIGSSIAYWFISVRKAGFHASYLRSGWDAPMFRKLAAFGGGMFLLTLGTHLLTMSQTALVTKNLGVAAAAVWATAPKLFQLISQMISKIWDYRIPHLSSMMSDERRTDLFPAFKKLFQATALIGGCFLGTASALNPGFLQLWTNEVISWAHLNDCLIAAGIYLSLLIRCVTDFVLHTKKVGWMPFLMLVEGILFVISSLFLLPRYGIPGMLAASLVAGGIFRLPYAWVCFSNYLGLLRAQKIQLLATSAAGMFCGLGMYAWLLLAGKILPEFSPLGSLLARGTLAALMLAPFLGWFFWKNMPKKSESI